MGTLTNYLTAMLMKKMQLTTLSDRTIDGSCDRSNMTMHDVDEVDADGGSNDDNDDVDECERYSKNQHTDVCK